MPPGSIAQRTKEAGNVLVIARALLIEPDASLIK